MFHVTMLFTSVVLSSTGLGILQGHIAADAPELVVDPTATHAKVGYTVVNTGTANLVVKELRVSGDQAFITYGMMSVYAVEPGGRASFSVEFWPKAPHPHEGWITALIAYDPAQLYRARVAKEQERLPVINRLKNDIGKLRIEGPDYGPIEMKEAKADLEWRRQDDKLLDELIELRMKLRDLQSEKEDALEELRQGRFCSDCGRAASQFSSEYEFRGHIQEAAHKGRHAKPATPEQLKKKEQELDGPIDKKRAAIERKEGQIERARQEHQKRLEEFKQLRFKLEQVHEQELAALVAEVTRREQWLEREIAEIRALEGQVSKLSLEIRGITRREE